MPRFASIYCCLYLYHLNIRNGCTACNFNSFEVKSKTSDEELWKFGGYPRVEQLLRRVPQPPILQIFLILGIHFWNAYYSQFAFPTTPPKPHFPSISLTPLICFKKWSLLWLASSVNCKISRKYGYIHDNIWLSTTYSARV